MNLFVRKLTPLLISITCGTAYGGTACQEAKNPEGCRTNYMTSNISTALGSGYATHLGIKNGMEWEYYKLNKDHFENFHSTDGRSTFSQDTNPNGHHLNDDFINNIARNTPAGSEVVVNYQPSPEVTRRILISTQKTKLEKLTSQLEKVQRTQNSSMIDYSRAEKQQLIARKLRLEDKIKQVNEEIKKIRSIPKEELQSIILQKKMTADKNAKNITEALIELRRKQRGAVYVGRKLLDRERVSLANKYRGRTWLSFGVATLAGGYALTNYTTGGSLSRHITDRYSNDQEWSIEDYQDSAN